MEAALARGQHCFSNGNYVDALKAYSEAVELDASCARAWSNRSACLAKLGKFEDALQDADEAIKADTTFTKAIGRRAAALQGLKRYEEAAESFRAALTHDPSNAIYQAGLSEVMALIQQGRGVVGQLSKNKFYFDKSIREGKDAMVKGSIHEAIRHFTRAIELWTAERDTLGTTSRDGAVLFSNRSAAYFRLQKMEASVEDAVAAVAADDGYSRGFLRLAMALRGCSRLDDAKRNLETCLRCDPDNSMARDEMQSLLSEIAERNKSNATQVAELQQKRDAMADAGQSKAGDSSEGATHASGDLAAAMRRQAGPAHATSYVYCSFCNTYNHDRSECPVLRQARKRPRD